jgi:hypothetical protein
MDVKSLIALLQEMDADAEVRVASQPSWPLALHVAGVAAQADIDVNDAFDDLEGDEFVDEDEVRRNAEAIVWIVEGTSVFNAPYAPRGAWNVATAEI